jgi:predicted TIM-barrel fold metal-dependent hydrolase
MDNSAIIDAAIRSKGNLRAVVRFDNKTTDMELEELNEAGARGARFSLMSDRPGNVAMIEHALPRMKKLNWSLVLHVESHTLIEHQEFIQSIPIPTVIDHLARCRPSSGLNQSAFVLLLKLIRNDQFWTKICSVDKISEPKDNKINNGLPFSDVIPFGKAVIETAPEKILWGTDWPHGNTFNPGQIPNEGDLLDLLAEMAGSKTILEKILVQNPERLYFQN